MALGRARLDVAGMTARFHLTSKQDYVSLGRGHVERDQIETFLALLRERTGHRPEEIFDLIERSGLKRSFGSRRGDQDFGIFARTT
jgi:hypothetical protein